MSDRNVFGVYTYPDIRMHYTRHVLVIFFFLLSYFGNQCAFRPSCNGKNEIIPGMLAMCRKNAQGLILVKLHAFKLSSIFVFVEVLNLAERRKFAFK